MYAKLLYQDEVIKRNLAQIYTYTHVLLHNDTQVVRQFTVTSDLHVREDVSSTCGKSTRLPSENRHKI